MNNVPDGLSVESVHVWHGDRHVLKGVGFELHPGQLLHLSGPNGAGKTTLLRVICGLLRPEQGMVAWLGNSIAKIRSDYQANLAYAAHDPALKGDLTALENLKFSIGLRRRVTELQLRGSLERVGVGACADLPARILSAGQRRRVAMARVLAAGAKLWLLDEPFTNLDAAGAELMSQLLAEHVRHGGLVLVVAHYELKLAGEARRLELAE